MKLDKNANIIWIRNPNLYAYELIKEINDGSIIIGERDFAKLDDAGNEIIWNKKYWDLSNIGLFVFIKDFIQTSDGGYLLTGRYNLAPNYDTFVIKTDCNGNLEWDTNSCLLPTEQDVSVFPNPFQDEITFQLPSVNKENDSVTIKITNVLGQTILWNKYSNQNIVNLNTNQFASGVYIYSVLINKSVYKSGKIIKQ